MGKKKKEKKDNTDITPPKKSRKLIKIVVGMVLLIALLAGGGVVYTTFFHSDYPGEDLEYVDLDEAVLRFTWEQLPNVYIHMVSANTELALMEKEIERIKGVGKEYPKQDRIVSSEMKRWAKIVKKISSQLQRFQSQVEALYVTFQVNPDKGYTAIEEKGTDLAASMGEMIAEVQVQTEPLKAAEAAPKGFKGIIAKIKNRFL